MIQNENEEISRNLKAENYFDKTALNIKVIKRSPEINYPLHYHDFYELIYVIEGNGTHFSKKEEQSLQRGDVICIVPGFFHGYKNCQNLILYNILIGTSLINNLNDDVKGMDGFSRLFLQQKDSYGRINLQGFQRTEIEQLIKHIQIESEIHSIPHGSKTMLLASFWSLIVHFCRAAENTFFLSPQSTQRIQNVFEYIDKSLDRKITTDELVDIANMSASTLNRCFKKAVGLAPVEYQIQRRINKACNLMLSTAESMEQIAEQTGFSDANYFSRQFKKIVKMTPTEYKNRWR